MRSTLLSLLLLLSVAGCRKPDYAYHTPCDEASRLRNIEKVRVLNAEEIRSLDSLEMECKQYMEVEGSRGKLWPYILGGVAFIVAAALVFLSLKSEPVVYN
jgi:hypothetical protein